MSGIGKEEMYEKLIEKTRELGRQVRFLDMKSDPKMPNPNDFAFYFGSFTAASEIAWAAVRTDRPITKRPVAVIKPKTVELNHERAGRIFERHVQLFIENEAMPPLWVVLQGQDFTREEIFKLFDLGVLSEEKVQAEAERRTGLKYKARRKRNGDKAKQRWAKYRTEQPKSQV